MYFTAKERSTLNIVLLGPPCSGKGTQASFIKDNLDIHHLSTGDLLRNNIEQNTSLSETIKSFIDKGFFVPDNLIIQMVDDYISSLDKNTDILFDGFPRNYIQCKKLDEILEKYDRSIDYVIRLDVNNRNILIDRMVQRFIIENRSDDNILSFSDRLDLYYKEIGSITHYYNNLYILNATQDKDILSKQISDIISV